MRRGIPVKRTSDPESKLRLLWNHHAIFNGPLSNARCLTGLDEPRSVQSRSTGRKARRGQRGKLCKKRYHAANAIRLIAQPRQKRKVDLAGGILASRRPRSPSREPARRLAGSRVASACCHVPSIFSPLFLDLSFSKALCPRRPPFVLVVERK